MNERMNLWQMNHTQRVAWFRANPPSVGSNGSAYRNGLNGLLNLNAPRGSLNAAAYRAGVLDGRSTMSVLAKSRARSFVALMATYTTTMKHKHIRIALRAYCEVHKLDLHETIDATRDILLGEEA